MQLWRLGTPARWSESPCADDPPYAYVEGPDPIRVLLLGGNAVAGFGVLTHELGLVGQIGRQLAHATGRGIEVEACGRVGMTINELVSRVDTLPRVRTGIVVIALGINDILRMTSLPSWARDLNRLFDLIREDRAENVQIVVVKAPPMHKANGFAWLPQRIVVWQSRLLNEATRRLCSRLDYVTLVPSPMTDDAHWPGMEGGSEDSYRSWASELTIHMKHAALYLGHTYAQHEMGSQEEPELE
jgi:lysophospholipase L1-like esterase